MSGIVSHHAENRGAPAVVAFLAMGVLMRAIMQAVHAEWAEIILRHQMVEALAAFGSLLLLADGGMHTSRDEMLRVGGVGTQVAVTGVIVPLVTIGALAYALWGNGNTALFAGATFVATSVGITSATFTGLNAGKTYGAQVVLAAGVIDDVLGLVVAAVATNVVQTGTVSWLSAAGITATATVYVATWMWAGEWLAHQVSAFIGRLGQGTHVRLGFVLAWLAFGGLTAAAIGLSPIIGAFAAGMSLMPRHTVRLHVQDEDHRLAGLVDQLNMVAVPVFFLLTGFRVDPYALATSSTLAVGGVLGIIAVLTKLPSGWWAAKERWVVAVGMAPRGEVGLVFLALGSSLGVFNAEIYSVLMVALVVSTVAPLLLLPRLLTAAEEGGSALTA
jgi:Kef-type K+ transport system membrane component KefB